MDRRRWGATRRWQWIAGIVLALSGCGGDRTVSNSGNDGTDDTGGSASSGSGSNTDAGSGPATSASASGPSTSGVTTASDTGITDAGDDDGSTGTVSSTGTTTGVFPPPGSCFPDGNTKGEEGMECYASDCLYQINDDHHIVSICVALPDDGVCGDCSGCELWGQEVANWCGCTYCSFDLVEVLCGPDPTVTDKCCYLLDMLRDPDCSETTTGGIG